MKQYILRITLLFLPVIISLVTLECLLRNMPNDYSFKHDRMISEGSDFQFLVLGSSHAYRGIDPDVMGSSGFNAANVSQDIHFDRFILEEYIPFMPNVKDLILSVSYNSLRKRLDDGPESWRIKNYVLYMDADQETYLLKEHFELLNRPLLDNLEQALRYMQGGSNIACSFSGAGQDIGEQENDIEEDATIAAKRHTLNLKYHDEVFRDFDAMITFALEHGIRVHLTSTPVTRSYRSNLDPAQLEEVKSTCVAYADRYPNVEYYDLMDDDRFVLNDFVDADHLSRSGQIKLSRILADTMMVGHVSTANNP